MNRPISVTEKFGSTVINTQETVYDAAGQPTTVTENGRATAFVYDSMGRKTQATLPGERIIHYEYYLTGEPKKVYGAENYTQTFTWNGFGNKASLSTYRSGNTADTTSWTYNSRNFITAKTYADGKNVRYTYDADGRLLSRLWARGITTSYAYDNAGRQTGITYSDGTPGISFTYDFLNRITDVTDGTGSRAFSYNADSTLASESIPYIVNSGLTYAYDNLGRRMGMTLNQNNTPLVANQYTYDNMSRIATVSDGTNTATYTRVPGTNLLSGTTITAGGVTKLSTARTYDDLHRLTGISSTTGPVTKAYNYTYDASDRRTQLNMPDGSYWTYGYDDKGQIISGVKHDAAGNVIPGQSFGYDYDGIGNLTAERRGIAEMNIAYTANNVNQYTSRAIPGIVPVIGEADAAAAVKVIRNDTVPVFPERAMVPVRSGKYFQGVLAADNTQTAKTVPYTVYAIKDDTVNNKQLVHKETGSYTVPKASQPFAYDLDGNTTGDGAWVYTWNGENRLVKAEKANYKKLEFAYDYMGRRTEKRAYASVNNAWNLLSVEKYVYKGWNLIAVYDGNDALQKSYLWGIDLSGSLQGAGGVGGLLAENSNSTSYYPVYDGSGNIRAYVDNTGASVAEYDYGPFGNITVQSGSLADNFRFRFSTKPLDQEFDSYDFGKRIYRVDMMRWLSQDPMEERGGSNLYCFVKNNPMSRYDVLGMWGSDIHYDLTKRLAIRKNYSSSSAEFIGQQDINTDQDGSIGLWDSGFLNPFGGQAYHFNMNSAIGDTRDSLFNMHMARAKGLCHKKMGTSSSPRLAAYNFGRGLHARQDISAHGDFGKDSGYNLSWHNSNSPQTKYGAPQGYPDAAQLDAEGDPYGQGVPRKDAIKTIILTMDVMDADGKLISQSYSSQYAIFKPGTQRLKLVTNDTNSALSEFWSFLTSDECSCECKNFFGAK